ncbi:fibroblast growth factor [Ectropis obliqua nucleopolyhedrovirus]|nr:fibroblast growth factor [Ectropis obliqua nucleopolyhedrovirus]ABI35778.1 fibroblast growth factor [Ectropis obliqua nucleopolyhedrovirus]
MVLCKFFNVCAATKIVIGILVAAVVVIDHVHCKPFDETYIETTGGNDAVVTNETSIFTKTGTGNRVKLFVNKKFLLGNEDGTINATTLIDKFHDDIVWQRYSLKGEIVIRNSKHCYFVCINDCGYVYSTNLPTRDCLFVEELNESHYTYFYRKYKTSKMYLAVNLEGKTRRTVVDDVELLGKLTTPSAFTVIDHLTSAEDFATEKCAEIQSVQSRINVSPKKMCKIVKRRFKKENKIVGNEIPNDLTLKSLESGHHNMTNESAIEIVEWVNN